MMRCKLLGVLALAAVVALPRPGLAGGGMSKALPQAASGLGNSTRNLAARNSVRNLASSGRPGDGATRATMASQLSTLKRGPQTEAAAPAVKESALKEAVAPAAPVARSGG